MCAVWAGICVLSKAGIDMQAVICGNSSLVICVHSAHVSLWGTYYDEAFTRCKRLSWGMHWMRILCIWRHATSCLPPVTMAKISTGRRSYCKAWLSSPLIQHAPCHNNHYLQPKKTRSLKQAIHKVRPLMNQNGRSDTHICVMYIYSSKTCHDRCVALYTSFKACLYIHRKSAADGCRAVKPDGQSWSLILYKTILRITQQMHNFDTAQVHARWKWWPQRKAGHMFVLYTPALCSRALFRLCIHKPYTSTKSLDVELLVGLTLSE